MTKGISLAALTVSLAAVAVSQLVFKARLPLAAAYGNRPLHVAAWHALSDPLLWVGGVLVLVGVICWYVAMIRLPLSFMLPMAALLAPTGSIGAYYFLGEDLTFSKISAILIIAAGAIWLGWLNS